MANEFRPFRLNPSLQERVAKGAEDEDMREFLLWLLEWAGERMHFARVPSLEDVVQEANRYVNVEDA